MAIASGTSLIAGFLTPGAGAVAASTTIAIAIAWSGTPSGDSGIFMDAVAAGIVTADAAALVLLGPGAHSIDSYLFGRREIVIPHDAGSR